ncbi:hypothetical protein FE257_009918 [Aspergillus nanangensis]|uniref:ZIP metal ion transporter n=1 Tax=Aspergillus nanangensis TaxID=2582783 RepID=A0AAD4CXT6_ASPNN|nr:hypothetical protein FE257_009918 [Aspergillus nanangensis]
MEGLFTLLALSIVMAVTFISSIGMGVLVGTSLIVIIPEGVETLYSSSSTSGRKDLSSRSTTAISWQHQGLPAITAPTLPNSGGGIDILEPSLPSNSMKSSSLLRHKDTTIHVVRDQQSGMRKRKEDESHEDEHDEEHSHDDGHSPHAWIGIALISGFILMYLIDKIPEFASSSKQERVPYHISLDNLSSGLRRDSSPPREGGLLDAGNIPRSSHSFATTTGLVIHAAADGIALGASSSDTGLSFIIFLAIMVHKAPASFGLTSILLKQGLSSRAARAHLLVFSLAAPVGALATFLFVHLVGADSSSDEVATRWRTGMLLLFSAGTFLYVAMHTMQENSPSSSSRELRGNGYGDPREIPPKSDKSMRDLVASVIGMILPLFLQIGHAH